RLLADVRDPRRVVVLHDGEAGAVDGDRVADGGAVEHPGGGDPVSLPGPALEPAELLDDPGEHVASFSRPSRALEVAVCAEPAQRAELAHPSRTRNHDASSGRSRNCSSTSALASASTLRTGRPLTTSATASSVILPLRVRGMSA